MPVPPGDKQRIIGDGNDLLDRLSRRGVRLCGYRLLFEPSKAAVIAGPRAGSSLITYGRGVKVLLRGGPGNGQVVSGGGETVVWQACLYEITPEYGRRSGRDLRVYRHCPDRCE